MRVRQFGTGVRNVVIDRVLAGRIFSSQSAVGRTILMRITPPEPERFTVVGVVEHQRHVTLAHDGREAVFVAEGYIGYGAANR